jgi:excisionase family DNA binding protein
MNASQIQVLLTVPQVMERTQLGRHKIYELINSRRLASVRVGRCRRIPAVAVDKLVSDLIERGGC